MGSRELVLDYDGERVTFDVEGDTCWGAPGVLLEQDDNLVAGRPWADAGFSVEPFLAPPQDERLSAGIQALLERRIAGAGLAVPAAFSMERYHEVVTTDAAHERRVGSGPLVLRAVGPSGPARNHQRPRQRDPRAARFHRAPARRVPRALLLSRLARAAATTTRPTVTSGSTGCATR